MDSLPAGEVVQADEGDAYDTSRWFSLKGRVALVTGAGRGIGAAIAVAFASAGADVAIAARTKDQLEQVAARIEARGRRALIFPGDVNQLDWLPTIIERTVAELGHLDVLVNNAGGSVSYPILDTRVEHLVSGLHFNVLAPFELSRLAIPHLLERQGASIINISSTAWVNAPRASLVHGTTKGAIAQMTRLMANDLAPRVRVNAILPGAIETASLAKWIKALPAAARATMRERIAMRRPGSPADIAAAALYLAAPASGWVTGELMRVDGMTLSEIVPKDVPDL